MTTSRKTLGICDICGFRFKLRDLKKNSYGLMVCSTDYERYDLKNHPQNKIPKRLDDEKLKDVLFSYRMKKGKIINRIFIERVA